MDLNSMLNSGEPENKSKTSPPAALRNVPPSTPRNGHTSAAAKHHHTPATQPRPPSSGSPTVGPHGFNMAPSHGMMPGAGNLPYSYPPQQPPLNSRIPPVQHHHAQEPIPSPASATRPSSHGYQYPHPPMGTYPNQGSSHIKHPVPTVSHSPTPPRHSQTPQSARQSPRPLTSGYPVHHPPHHSQPSTPLGPPSLPHQRSSGHVHDLNSPYHVRTLSAASNGLVGGSPAPHNVSIGSIIDSPSQHRQTPQRRTSDHIDAISRERSVSVSPKTIVQPRPLSVGSRTSSQQDIHSARSSVQPSDSHRHLASVQTHSPNGGAQISDNSKPHVLNAPPEHGHVPLAEKQGFVSESSLSQTNNQFTIQHQTQKMGMNHLLSPATGIPPHLGTTGINAEPSAHDPKNGTRHPLNASPAPKTLSSMSPVRTDHRSTEAEIRKVGSTAAPPSATKDTLKRPADPLPPAEHPHKRNRTRKYDETPIWAQLSPGNPISHGQQKGTSSASSSKDQHSAVQPHSQTNGHQPQPIIDGDINITLKPWQQNPPLDNDLIKARQHLGAWEKSILYDEPYLDMHRTIQDWLFVELDKLGDIGSNSQEGMVEIEAKVGYLVRKDTDDRLRLPIRSAAVLDDHMVDPFRFESQMELHAHKSMNEFLNKSAAESAMFPGRAKVNYQHPRETDSFRTLSRAGYQALPPAFHNLPRSRELKLRTSTDDATGKVTARIVKIQVAHLHILNPAHPYDCRISINVEANLDRPELAPFDDLSVEPTIDKPAQPDRRKDRMSYKHLAYSIDLTKVEISRALPPKFELEVEVDAQLLRRHQQLCRAGQGNAYQDIVGGFINNVTLLMRQRQG